MPPYLAVSMNFSSPDHNERPWDSITHTTEAHRAFSCLAIHKDHETSSSVGVAVTHWIQNPELDGLKG